MESVHSLLNTDTEGRLFDIMELQSIVDILPDRLRAVVALRAAGYTQLECSEILGVTRAAIGYMQRRAFDRIQEELITRNQDPHVN